MSLFFRHAASLRRPGVAKPSIVHAEISKVRQKIHRKNASTYIYRCVFFLRREAIGSRARLATFAGANGGKKRLVAAYYCTESVNSHFRHADDAAGEAYERSHRKHRMDPSKEKMIPFTANRDVLVVNG